MGGREGFERAGLAGILDVDRTGRREKWGEEFGVVAAARKGGRHPGS